MTHEEAFLQALLENPGDDLPRLVYADWLIERGDPRGEFVHVQCLLARLVGNDSRRPQLETRERELLDRHQDAWLGPLRPLLSAWTFRRGFLAAVVVPAATYLRHAALPLPATVRRVEVDLDGFEVPLETIEFVPESVAYENSMLPIGFRGRTLVVAMSDPNERSMLEKLEFILNRGVEAVATPKQQLIEAIRRHYGEPQPAGPEPDLTGCFVSPPPFPPDEVDIRSWDSDSRVTRLLARLVATAIGQGAREVHIEPEPEHIRVRYVCNAGITEGGVTPLQLLRPIVTRLRIMAGIWLDDPRDVQAGAVGLTVRDKRVDVGVLIRRTDAGPAVVLTFRPPGSGVRSG
jgi:uncharacterized protein (TIGR02996 family)